MEILEIWGKRVLCTQVALTLTQPYALYAITLTQLYVLCALTLTLIYLPDILANTIDILRTDFQSRLCLVIGKILHFKPVTMMRNERYSEKLLFSAKLV
jgi:hypothetical protein